MVKRKASSAMSKTKAKAMTRKPKICASITKATGSSPDQVLLAKLMEQHAMDPENASLSFADIMMGLGMNDHNTKWRNAWKAMREQGYIQSCSDDNGGIFTGAFELTPSGIDIAATDEYKQAMLLTTAGPSNCKTNQELHDHIKSKLMNKRGDQIFDLLLERGTQSRKELAAVLGISDRGAYFSYAFQQLKELGYVEVDPTVTGKKKKVRLSDKAFVTPRPAVKAAPAEPEKEEEKESDQAATAPTKEEEAE